MPRRSASKIAQKLLLHWYTFLTISHIAFTFWTSAQALGNLSEWKADGAVSIHAAHKLLPARSMTQVSRYKIIRQHLLLLAVPPSADDDSHVAPGSTSARLRTPFATEAEAGLSSSQCHQCLWLMFLFSCAQIFGAAAADDDATVFGACSFYNDKFIRQQPSNWNWFKEHVKAKKHAGFTFSGLGLTERKPLEFRVALLFCIRHVRWKDIALEGCPSLAMRKNDTPSLWIIRAIGILFSRKTCRFACRNTMRLMTGWWYTYTSEKY